MFHPHLLPICIVSQRICRLYRPTPLVYLRTILINVLHLSAAGYRHRHRCHRYILLLPGAGTRTRVLRRPRCHRIYFHRLIVIDRHRLNSVAITFHLLLHLARYYLHPSERRIHGGKNHCRPYAILVSILISENERAIIKVCENNITQRDDTFIIDVHSASQIPPVSPFLGKLRVFAFYHYSSFFIFVHARTQALLYSETLLEY